MRLLIPTLAAVAIAAFASPALAFPDCRTGVGFRISTMDKDFFTNEQRQLLDKMNLRQHGIDAEDVQRSSRGCLRVVRKDPVSGSLVLEFYDPRTYEQVF